MKNGVLMTTIAAVTVLVCFFVLAGCRDSGPEDTFDSRLVGSWTNDPNGSLAADEARKNEVKTFTIQSGHSFVASIDPFGKERGEVTGVLVGEDGKYIMTGMKANGVSWGGSVGAYNGAEVKIIFSKDDVFILTGDATINLFFGDTYHKKISP
jgi:hypothetical protein